MQSVVAHIQENDVVNPTLILLEERNRQKNINPNARWYVCSDIYLYISRNLLPNCSREVSAMKICPFTQWPRGFVDEFVTHNGVMSFNLSQRPKLYLFFFVLRQLTSDDHSRELKPR